MRLQDGALHYSASRSKSEGDQRRKAPKKRCCRLKMGKEYPTANRLYESGDRREFIAGSGRMPQLKTDLTQSRVTEHFGL